MLTPPELRDLRASVLQSKSFARHTWRFGLQGRQLNWKPYCEYRILNRSERGPCFVIHTRFTVGRWITESFSAPVKRPWRRVWRPSVSIFAVLVPAQASSITV